MKEKGVLTLSEEAWEEAKKRREVIARLAEQEKVGEKAAEEAAKSLGLSVRHLYRLIRRYKTSSELVTDLAIFRPEGGRRKSRLGPEIELIISEIIEALYLTRQKRPVAVIAREVRKRCLEEGQNPPSYNTVASRIELLDPILKARKRQGGNATRRLRPASGETPKTEKALEVVQIDHTKMDVVVVDTEARLPIGRPSLSLAIDVYTRCVVGMLLTLEAPSAISVGLCLTHVVNDKASWLEDLGLSRDLWPMYGKPEKIHVDNAPEFRSEALNRGCDQYGIEIDYRPKGQPHFGGIIERVIGTAMKMAHELPGTTFSNVQERGTYKSESKASLTLGELEKWLVLAIGTYHKSAHGTLLEAPSEVWNRASRNCEITTVNNHKTFLLDFLPLVRRRITRTGFVIGHVRYYGEALNPWIAKRDRLDKFIIRYDPRNLSRVWLLDPESDNYFEIPYRFQSHPAITQWEHREAIRNLRKRGREKINETEVFDMIEQMREIAESASKECKRARRNKARRNHLNSKAQDRTVSVPESSSELSEIEPFEVEEWACEEIDLNISVPKDRKVQARKAKRFKVEKW